MQQENISAKIWLSEKNRPGDEATYHSTGIPVIIQLPIHFTIPCAYTHVHAQCNKYWMHYLPASDSCGCFFMVSSNWVWPFSVSDQVNNYTTHKHYCSQSIYRQTDRLADRQKDNKQKTYYNCVGSPINLQHSRYFMLTIPFILVHMHKGLCIHALFVCVTKNNHRLHAYCSLSHLHVTRDQSCLLDLSSCTESIIPLAYLYSSDIVPRGIREFFETLSTVKTLLSLEVAMPTV